MTRKFGGDVVYQIINDFLFNKQLTTGATALLTIIGSIMVALATALVTRNKFKAEKLWDEQKEACNTIVSQIRSAGIYGSYIEDGFSRDYVGYYDSTTFDKNNETYWELFTIASEAFGKNYLILPPRFRRRYEAMVKEAAQADFESGPDAYLTPIYAHKVAATDLLDIAVIELGIGGWWHRKLVGVRVLLRSLRAGFLRLKWWTKWRYRRVKRWTKRKLPWVREDQPEW